MSSSSPLESAEPAPVAAMPPRPKRDPSPRVPSDYIAIKRQLGKGHNAVVYLIEYNTDPTPRAMKKIPRNNKRTENMNRLRANNPARSLAHPSLPRTADPTALVDRRGTEEAKIRKEIAIMKKCDHPNIIKFLSFIDDQMSANICLIMEYMEGGELQWQVDNEPYLTMDQTRRCMRDVVLGLQYLHLQGIIHRDIKPSNIMWTADRSHVKIGDFGVAHLVSSSSSPDGDEEEYDAPRHAGTPAFLAPEIAPGAYSPSTHSTSSASKATGQTQTQAKREEAVTPAVDLWALGVTLYCMLFGRMPFEPERGALGGGGVAAEASLYRAIRESPWGLPRVLKSGSAAGGAGAGASGSGVRDEWDDVWGSGPKDAKERREKASRDDDGEEEEVERVTTMCSNRVVIVPADWDKNGVLGSLGGLLQKDPRVRWGIEQVKDVAWLLQGVQRRQEWISGTTPKIVVSAADEANAILEPRYKWKIPGRLRLGRRFSNLFGGGVRDDVGGSTGRSRTEEGVGAVRSEPGVDASREQREQERLGREKEKSRRKEKERKGKGRASDEVGTSSANSAATKDKSEKKNKKKDKKSRSVDTQRAAAPSSFDPSAKPRRGSDTNTTPPVPDAAASTSALTSKRPYRFFRWAAARDSRHSSANHTSTTTSTTSSATASATRLRGAFRGRAARHSTEALGSAPMGGLGAGLGFGLGAEQRTASMVDTAAGAGLSASGSGPEARGAGGMGLALGVGLGREGGKGGGAAGRRLAATSAEEELDEMLGGGRWSGEEAEAAGMIAAPRAVVETPRTIYVDEREPGEGESESGSESGCSYGEGARAREGFRDLPDEDGDEDEDDEVEEDEDADDDRPRVDVYDSTSSGDEDGDVPITFKSARARGPVSPVVAVPVPVPVPPLNGHHPDDNEEEAHPPPDSEDEDDEHRQPAGP